MWYKLEEVFKIVGLPYSRQGSYEEDEKLPDSFFTFWNENSEEKTFYNNKPTRCEWEWSIFFYTINPDEVYSVMDNFIKVAKENGFIISSRGRDIPTGEPNYYGRFVKIIYNEQY